MLSLLIVDYLVFSGGMNGEILVWRIPENYNAIDPYDTYDASLFLGTLDGHTDAVWSLVAVPANELAATAANHDEVDASKLADTPADEQKPKVKLICSASADGTVKVWDIAARSCVKTIVCDENLGKPTCLAALPPNSTLDSPSNIGGTGDGTKPAEPPAREYSPQQLLAASFAKGCIQIFDLNAATYSQPVLTLESSKTKNGTNNRINAIVVHPTLTVIVSAHQDRNLRFWDYTTGE